MTTKGLPSNHLYSLPHINHTLQPTASLDVNLEEGAELVELLAWKQDSTPSRGAPSTKPGAVRIRLGPLVLS